MNLNPGNKQLFNGLLWSVVEILIKRALDLVVKLILARLLFPEDFGFVFGGNRCGCLDATQTC